MRGILLSLMVVLAMSSVAFGTVTLDYVVSDYYAGPGLRTFTVQATGVGINALGGFQVVGDVNQVLTGTGGMTEWINNVNGDTFVDPLDSYVLLGDDWESANRLGDLPNTETAEGSGVYGGFGTVRTAESVTGGGNSGLGTFTNLPYLTPGDENYIPADVYFTYGTPSETSETVDLMQLVVPQGKSVQLEMTLYSAEYDSETGYFTEITEWVFDDSPEGLGSLEVKCVLDGDANSDGVVNLNDLSILLSNYNESGMAWVTGDFTGDGNVNLNDLSLLLGKYNQAADWYAPGEGVAVPEPGTLMMLVLGSLCLLGYRLRK